MKEKYFDLTKGIYYTEPACRIAELSKNKNAIIVTQLLRREGAVLTIKEAQRLSSIAERRVIKTKINILQL